MTFLEHRFSLDIRKDAQQVPVRVKRDDTARRLRILLVNGIVPYVIGQDCYAMFSAIKPDGNRIFNPCTIEDNRIVYELTPQTTAVTGGVECEIRLYGADDLLITSPSFELRVDDTLYDEDQIPQSETEATALTGLISDAAEVIAEGRELIGDYEEALDRIDTVLVDAQSYAERAEEAAQRAEDTANGINGDGDSDALVVQVFMETMTASMTRKEIEEIRSMDRVVFAVCDLFPGVPFQYDANVSVDDIWYARFTHVQVYEDQVSNVQLLIDDDGNAMHRSMSMSGETGPAGEAATLEISEVTSLEYGAAPTVTELEESTAQARKYSVGIPEGKPGANGASSSISLEEFDDASGTGIQITVSDESSMQIQRVYDGKNGHSPTIEVEDIDGGHRVTVTNAGSQTSFDVLDGKDAQVDLGALANLHVWMVEESSYICSEDADAYSGEGYEYLGRLGDAFGRGSALPEYTEADYGKFLYCSAEGLVWEAISNAEENLF